MRTRIVKIGNSQGVRIPKIFLEQSQITDEIEMEVNNRQIVIRSVTRPRADWEPAFQEMARQGDDALLDADAANQTSWDTEEWEWK